MSGPQPNAGTATNHDMVNVPEWPKIEDWVQFAQDQNIATLPLCAQAPLSTRAFVDASRERS